MKVFICAPFGSKIDKTTGDMNEEFKKLLKDIKNHLEQTGSKVYLAHEIECWGKESYTDNDCTFRDFMGMKEADIVLVILDNDFSGGTHVELGWASAMQKRIIIASADGNLLCSLVRGLQSIADVHFITFDSSESLIAKVATMRSEGIL